jgi:hypothetical protein
VIAFKRLPEGVCTVLAVIFAELPLEVANMFEYAWSNVEPAPVSKKLVVVLSIVAAATRALMGGCLW